MRLSKPSTYVCMRTAILQVLRMEWPNHQTSRIASYLRTCMGIAIYLLLSHSDVQIRSYRYTYAMADQYT